MFMEIAVAAMGIGIVIMIGYIVISQVVTSLPSSSVVNQANPCYDHAGSDVTYCNVTGSNFTDNAPLPDNTSRYLLLPNQGYLDGTASTSTTVYAGFGIVAVGIIVLAAFGLINIFK